MKNLKIRNYIDLILCKESFAIFSAFYCLAKRLPESNSYPFITYILILYGALVFFYTRVLKPKELIFDGCIFSYSIIIFTIISSLYNGIPNYIFFLRDLIPIVLNVLVLLPTYNYDDFNSISKFIFHLFVEILIFTFIIGCIDFFHLTKDIIFSFPNIPYFSGVRFGGMLSNYNLTCWFSTIGVGAALYMIVCNYMILDKNVFIKSIVYLSMFFNIIITIFSQSRGALIGIVFSIPFLLLLNKSAYNIFIKKRKLIISFMTLFSIIFASIIFFLSGRYGSGREEIYKFAITEYLNHNKFFGIGLSKMREVWYNDFLLFVNQYGYDIGNLTHIRNINTHNIPLFFLNCDGIIGCLLILYLYFMNIFYILKFLFSIEKYDIKTKKLLIIINFFCIIEMFISLVDNSIIISQTLFSNLIFCICTGFLWKLVNSNHYE